MLRQAKRVLFTLSVITMLLSFITLGRAAAAYCYSSASCSSSSANLFGQRQAYDVVLLSDGDAVVNARINLSNTGSSSLKYSIVNGQLQNVTAYQEVICSELPIIRTSKAANVSIESNPEIHFSTSTNIPECYPGLAEHPLNSSTPLAYYFPSSYEFYKSIAVTKSVNAFTLSLPQSVNEDQSTTIVMLYSESGVSHKSLGMHYYSLQTLKTAGPVNDVNVGISVEGNYVLANSGKSTNATPVISPNELSSNLQAGSVVPPGSAVNADINSYVNSIGDNGGITKQALFLLPQKTLTITGRFAGSTFLLNWPRTVSLSVLALVFIALVIYWYINNRKKIKEQLIMGQANTSGNDQDSSAYDQSSDNKVNDMQAENQKRLVSASTRKTVNINVRAIPFYELVAAFKQQIRERKVRPMIFAWICGVLTVLVVAGGAFGYSEATKLSNAYSTNNNPTPAFGIALYIALIAIGLLSFIVFSIGLPILYAGSFRRAMRIFFHLIIFFIIVLVLAIFLGLQLRKPLNPNTCNSAYGCCGGYGISSGLCSGIQQGGPGFQSGITQ